MPDNNYRYLKDLQNNVIKPVTDLAAVNLTTANGILVDGNTIGIPNGYVASCAFMELTDPATAANPDSAYIEGGTMFTLIGGYTVTDDINTGAPDAGKVPNEVAVANLVNTIETITGNTIHSVGEGLYVDGTQMRADFATTEEVLTGSSPRKAVCVQALDEAIRDHADTPDLGGVASLDADYLVGHYDVAPWGVIENIPTDATTWEIKPGHAYKLLNLSGPIELTATACPPDGFGTEAHIEIFNAGDGYIHFGQTIVIGADALTANAVNDCTVRFHGGIATLQVEDVISGIYDVTTSETSGEGSLDTAFNAGSRFVRIESGVIGSAVFETAVTNPIDAVVMDNQYVPIVIGGFKTQGTNTAISINESTKVVTVTAGTFTLSDYTIPNGSTVAVSGGGLAVEKVTGAGSESVIDLEGTHLAARNSTTVINASGCVITGGTYTYGGAALIDNYGQGNFFGCTFPNNTATTVGNVVYVGTNGTGVFSSCTFPVNSGTYNIGCGGTLSLIDCDISGLCVATTGGNILFGGSNAFHDRFATNDGSVTLTSGAVLDLTGNTNATPINPGGGITFASGGATVLYSSGAVSGSYMMDNVTLPAGAKLTNTAVVDLNSNASTIPSGSTASVNGCVFSGGSGTDGGAFNAKGKLVLSNTEITSCNGGLGAVYVSGNLELVDCYVHGETAFWGAFYMQGGSVLLSGSTIGRGTVRIGSVTIAGNNTIGNLEKANNSTYVPVTISSGASINLTSSINPGGTGGITVLTGGCTVNSNVIPAGTYTSINSDGQPT